MDHAVGGRRLWATLWHEARERARLLGPTDDLWRRVVLLGMTCAAGLLCWNAVVACTRILRTRLFEGYAIQWLEPIFLRIALRAQEGLPLYAPPTPEYAPTMYTPAYFVLSGWLFDLFGPGYVPMRFLSVAWLVVLLGVVSAWAWRASRSAAWAVIAVVLVLSLDAPLDDWLTQANLDIPYLACALAGLFLLHSWPGSPRAVLAAGACMAVSFLFKQPGLIFGAAGFAYLLAVGWRQALRYAAVMGAILAPVLAYYLLQSDGAFWTAVFVIPLNAIPKPDPRFLDKLFAVSSFGTICFFTFAPALALLQRGARSLFWVVVPGAAWYAARTGWSKIGGGENSLLPLFLLGLVMPALLVGLLARGVEKPRLRRALSAVFLSLMIVVLYRGYKTTIDRGDRLRATLAAEVPGPTYPGYRAFDDKVLNVLDTHPGPVFVGARPDLLLGRYRPRNLHQSSLYQGTHCTSEYDLAAVLEEPLRAHAWSAMVLWAYGEKPFDDLVAKYYVRKKELGTDPLIGLKVAVWEPKPRTTPPPRAKLKRGLRLFD